MMSTDECFRCGKPGHWACSCSLYTCRLCGKNAPGHYSIDCTEYGDWMCINCGHVGHLYITCTEPWNQFNCQLCKEPGHGLVMCPKAGCWTCKQPGHIPWRCPRNLATKSECKRCGERGHVAPMCTRWTMITKDVPPSVHELGAIEHLLREADKLLVYESDGNRVPGAEDHLYSKDEEKMSFEALSRSSSPCFASGQSRQQPPAPGNPESPPVPGGTKPEYWRSRASFATEKTGPPVLLAEGDHTDGDTDSGGHKPEWHRDNEARTGSLRVYAGKRKRAISQGSRPTGSKKARRVNVAMSLGNEPPTETVSPHGPTCTCTMCTRTHTLDEYSINDVAMGLWTRGATALASGKTRAAIRLFDQCIAEDATAVVFFRSRGDAHVMAKDYVAALGDFEQAYDLMEAAPPSRAAPVLSNMARCHLCLGSCHAAMRAVREALSVDPAYKPARALERRLVRLQEGEEAFRRALASGRWHAARSSWETCVRVYEEEGCAVPVAVRCWEVDLAVVEQDWGHAESMAEEISNEKPEDIRAILTRINVLILVDELQAALEQTTAGLRLDPDNASLKSSRTRIKDIYRLNAQGDAHMDSRDHGAALRDWQCVLEVVPDGPEDGGGGLLRAQLLFKKAQAELKLRQFAEGLGSVNASLKLDAARWDSYLVKGRCHVGLRQRDLAVKDFRTCLRKAEVNGSGASAGDIALLRGELQRTERLAARSSKTVMDYYKILGVTPDCTLAEVRMAYKKALFKYHPDKGGIEDKFKLVKEAYSVLSDPDAGRKL